MDHKRLPVFSNRCGKIDCTCRIWLATRRTYLVTVALLSLVGSHEFGGLGWLPFGWDMGVVGLASLGFCFWGVHSGLARPDLDSIAEPEDLPTAAAVAH